MPEITIRHAHINDCPALAQIIIQATQDAFRGRVPDLCFEWLTPEVSTANWAKNFKTEQTLNSGNYLFVAENSTSGVIGLAMLSKIQPQANLFQFINENYSHELRSLQILPTWQKQGVGRSLLSQVANQVENEGGTHLLVKMLVKNPNLGIYEHLGAIKLGSNSFNWEGYETKEIIYGWENVSNLRNAA